MSGALRSSATPNGTPDTNPDLTSDQSGVHDKIIERINPPNPVMPFIKGKIKAVLIVNESQDEAMTNLENIQGFLQERLLIASPEIIDASIHNPNAENALNKLKKSKRFAGILTIPQQQSEEAAEKKRCELSELIPKEKTIVFVYKDSHGHNQGEEHVFHIYT